ncbi:MAG: polysaccharide pyruvyl transferase family protein [Clostridiales bacterium]|nr:polysaccharide pyruvyl transferase family protein [Clostridiales bacterium]
MSENNIFEYVIEKRNELADELYSFWDNQKREMFEYINQQDKKLSDDLYSFFETQKKELQAKFYTQIEMQKQADLEYVDYRIQDLSEKLEKQWNTEREFGPIREFFSRAARAGKRSVVILGTPEHSNIGDHAISCGEKTFFETQFPENPLLMLSWRTAWKYESYLTDHIQKDDLICIQGGGFLGSLWEEEQQNVTRALVRFQDNPVVILPQTYWSGEGSNDNRIVEFAKAMADCRKLLVCLREKDSLERFCKRFQGIQTMLVPDMTFCIHTNLKMERNNTALLCMRADKEKVFDQDQAVKDYLESLQYQIRNISTMADEEVIPSELSELYVWRKMEEFASGKLIVTDWLHGLIFAALTKTPCIAFNNLSGKVEAIYQWVRECEQIVFVKDMKEFKDALGKINLTPGKVVLPDQKFDELTAYIRELR